MNPISLILGALVGVAYLVLSPKKASASTGGLVQTAKVGDNLYTVTRMGNGQYVVVLTSVKGQLNQFPVSVLLNQNGITQRFGDTKQLEADLNRMSLDFSK